MPEIPPNAISDKQFLEMRARLLDLAAALDRIQLAQEACEGGPDRRLQQIRLAIEILRESEAGRAEKLQLHFSRPYESDWRTRWGL